MSFFTRIESGDDPEFMGLLEQFIEFLTGKIDRPKLFVIRVDNWFDHKWLGFAGKTHRRHEEFPNIVVSAARWYPRDEFTLPPFSPNRILDQKEFDLDADKITQATSSTKIHRSKKTPSSQNILRNLRELCGRGLFIWFSSQSSPNGRASMMVYQTKDDNVGGWYVSFLKKDRWQVNQVKNIKRDIVADAFSGFYEK